MSESDPAPDDIAYQKLKERFDKRGEMLKDAAARIQELEKQADDSATAAMAYKQIGQQRDDLRDEVKALKAELDEVKAGRDDDLALARAGIEDDDHTPGIIRKEAAKAEMSIPDYLAAVKEGKMDPPKILVSILKPDPQRSQDDAAAQQRADGIGDGGDDAATNEGEPQTGNGRTPPGNEGAKTTPGPLHKFNWRQIRDMDDGELDKHADALLNEPV